MVVIPGNVRPSIDFKHTAKEQSKPADEEKAPSGRESCPICFELLPPHGEKLAYQPCCDNVLCAECAKKCYETNPNCPLCRAPAPKNNAEAVARLQRRVAKGDKKAQGDLGVAYYSGVYEKVCEGEPSLPSVPCSISNEFGRSTRATATACLQRR